MEIWYITWGFGAPYILHAYILHFLSLSLPEWRQFVYMGYEVILTSQKMQPSNDRTCVQCNIIAGVDMYIDWRQCIFNSATLSSRVADGSGLLLCSFYICVWQFVSVSLSLYLSSDTLIRSFFLITMSRGSITVLKWFGIALLWCGLKKVCNHLNIIEYCYTS